jgi:hypothetical protein
MAVPAVGSMLLLAVAAGCSQRQAGPSTNPANPRAEVPVSQWPKSFAQYLGQTVTLEGMAANAKSGPLLVGEGGEIWIDGLSEWPSEVMGAGTFGRGKRVRVTGQVIRRADLPAFVEKPGEPRKTGIPVASEAQLEAASTRFLLRGATWTVLE